MNVCIKRCIKNDNGWIPNTIYTLIYIFVYNTYIKEYMLELHEKEKNKNEFQIHYGK